MGVPLSRVSSIIALISFTASIGKSKKIRRVWRASVLYRTQTSGA